MHPAQVARGYYADNGPPTTLSGTGRDVSLSYQGFAAVDNVQFVNGNQLGTRMLFQVGSTVTCTSTRTLTIDASAHARPVSTQHTQLHTHTHGYMMTLIQQVLLRDRQTARL